MRKLSTSSKIAMAVNLPLVVAAFVLVPYIEFGAGYRGSIVITDITADLKRNHIKQGCSEPALMKYLAMRHAEPWIDHEAPYIYGWMGSKDFRTLGSMIDVRFQISSKKTVESYSFRVPQASPTWTRPQAGT